MGETAHEFRSNHGTADGVYMFNFFDPNSPLWRQLGSPETMQGLDKVYCTGARGVNVIGRWVPRATRFLNRKVLSPERPLRLEPGEPAAMELNVGERLDTEREGVPVPKVTLRLLTQGLASAEELSAKLNGKTLEGGKLANRWLEYPVVPALVSKGANRFAFQLAPESKSEPAIQDLLLWVRYPK